MIIIFGPKQDQQPDYEKAFIFVLILKHAGKELLLTFQRDVSFASWGSLCFVLNYLIVLVLISLSLCFQKQVFTYVADGLVPGKQKWIKREYPPAEEMLFFNVTAIGDDEEVRLAQLHLHRRRLTKTHGNYHRKLLPTPYRVVLYQVQPNFRQKPIADARTMKLASLPVSHITKGGWHSLDVTAVLRELLINAQGPIELLLGVQFEAPKGTGVTLKHFLKSSDSGNPYKSPSYMVVFSEIDPYFEYFDDYNDSSTTTSNAIPTASPRIFKERHLKHKILKDNENDLPNDISKFLNYTTTNKKKNTSKASKYRKSENEIYKNDRREDVRHKKKHKRSKADELALQRKNKLKSLPFLHANEVEEIRQTSRRLTRSLHENQTDLLQGSKALQRQEEVVDTSDIRRELEDLIKVCVFFSRRKKF